MRKIYLIVPACVILLSIFFLIKANTIIYIGDYTGNTRYVIDIEIKIDNREILNDNLAGSSAYIPDFIIKEELRYGLHKINVYSARANVSQEKYIFLLPNQHIYIDFIPADTLTLRHYCFQDSIIINGIRLSDSVIERDDFPDFSDYSMIRKKSAFIIESRFNPFYTE